jgi:tetratricopeptide (TPR) repeat protein
MKKILYLMTVIVLGVFIMSSSYLAKAIFEQGQKYYEAGDYDRAISNFVIVINDYPETEFFAKASLYLGVIYYDLNERAQAKRYLNLCIRRVPKGTQEWISATELLATIYYEEGNNEKAKELFNTLGKYSSKRKIISTRKIEDSAIQHGAIQHSAIQHKEKVITESKTPKAQEAPQNYSYVTNYVTNQAVTVVTNVVVITNYVTNYISTSTDFVGVNVSNVPGSLVTNLKEIQEKVSEIKEKDENLEELNRLTDIKNRLLKLSEKALMIQELLSNGEGKTNDEKGE